MSKPNINDMRKYILDKYPGTNWHERVYNMHPRQVVAIYKNLKKREAILKKLKESLPVFEPTFKDFHQIDIFEYLIDKEKELAECYKPKAEADLIVCDEFAFSEDKE